MHPKPVSSVSRVCGKSLCTRAPEREMSVWFAVIEMSYQTCVVFSATEIMSPRKVFFFFLAALDVRVRSRGCNCGVQGRGRPLAAGQRPSCALCLQQGSRRTLFIRRQRLRSAGGFSLLLLHCLSHVALQDMSCDSSPAFRRLFFRVTAQTESSFGEKKNK